MTAAVGTWLRHRELARTWCAIASAGDRGLAFTWCGGTIRVQGYDRDGQETAGDLDQFDLHDAPPHDDRCSACVRVLIERRRVELGLAELTAATTELTAATTLAELETYNFGAIVAREPDGSGGERVCVVVPADVDVGGLE